MGKAGVIKTEFDGKEVFLDIIVQKCSDNKSHHIELFENGLPFIKISVFDKYISPLLADKNMFLLKNWSENKGIEKILSNTAFFKNTGLKHKVSDFCEAPIYQMEVI